jgi:hypothetical protein
LAPQLLDLQLEMGDQRFPAGQVGLSMARMVRQRSRRRSVRATSAKAHGSAACPDSANRCATNLACPALPRRRRPGRVWLRKAITGDGVRTILIESPDRFARDLAVQLAHLKRLGVALVRTSAPDHFTEDMPTAILVRQVLGAIALRQGHARRQAEGGA